MLFSLWYCFEFADYLQIQPTRAPSEVLEVRKIRSPISQSEWKVHASVRNITRAADDPEALFIDAAPQDVITFLRITNWLAGLQRELDTSWAVLGEVYGRFTREGLNALALRLRRVRSNLDDLDAFADQVDYVPRRAAFDAANPDLLKLLVSPLYDDDPVYGIRELLQNALDAVRELRAHLERRPTASAVELAVQRADVELTIEFADGEPAWVTVSDKGIGMTVKTVLDYFLRAGASLRTSEAWRNEFQDESGRSIVLRSGRFGIGVLAAFLIGDELEVSTRHVDSAPNQGIAFRASLDTDAIALKWTTRPIGTTVRIKVSTTKANRISELAVLSDERRDRHWAFFDKPGDRDWDFYCLDWPRVARRISPGRSALKQRFALKVKRGKPPKGWRQLDVPKYESVFWTYEPFPHLVCNGIVVKRDQPFQRTRADWQVGVFGLEQPNVQVLDPDGKLPLNLRRTELIGGQLPFDDALLDSVLRDFVIYAVENAPQQMLSESDGYFKFYAGLVVGGVFSSRPYQCSPWIATKKGITVADIALLNDLSIDTLLFLPPWAVRELSSTQGSELLASCASGVVPFKESASRSESTLATDLLFAQGDGPLSEFAKGARGRRILFRKDLYGYLLSLKRLSADEKKVLVERAELLAKGQWVLVSNGECPDHSRFPFDEFVDQFAGRSGLPGLVDVAAELYRSEESLRKSNSKLAEVWTSVIGAAAIPFGGSTRRALRERLGTLRAGR